MKNCTISVSLRGKSFVSKFPIEKDTPEYMLADEAYRLAILFAQTQAIAIYGRANPHQFADLLKDLDYNYTVK